MSRYDRYNEHGDERYDEADFGIDLADFADWCDSVGRT